MPARWRHVAAWAVGVLCITSVPGSAVPRAGGVPGLDKVVHVAMYFGLGRAIAQAMAGSRGTRVLVTVAVFAAVDEWHQTFVPGRQGDTGDWVADVVGGALGIASIRARGRQEMVRES
jgi:VanZ family protein